MTQIGSLRMVAVLGVCGLMLALSCNRTSSRSRASATLTINEVMASANVSGVDLDDPKYQAVLTNANGEPLLDTEGLEGDTVDWVEIFNPNPFPIGLSGYTLSDNRQRPRKYRFPASTILPSGGFLLVVCDDRPESGPMHAPFRLDPGGETVFLFGSNGQVLLNQLSFGRVEKNVAVGRSPDGFRPANGYCGYDLIDAPTPLAPNFPTRGKFPQTASEDISLDLIDGETFRVTALVFIDEGGAGVDRATVEALGLPSCTAEGSEEPLQVEMEQVGGSETVPVERGDCREQPISSERFTFVAEFPRSAVPGLTADGVTRVRVVLETAIGPAFGFKCRGEQLATLVISEYQPRNQFTLRVDKVRSDGIVEPNVAPDWFEIYNYGTEPVSLEGFRVLGPGGVAAFQGDTKPDECRCDAAQEERSRTNCLFTWNFVCPAAGVQIDRIGPGESVLLFADQDRPPFRQYYPVGDRSPENQMHSVQFRLARDQRDSFGLIDSKDILVDVVTFDFSRDLGNSVLSVPCDEDDCDGAFQAEFDVSFGRFPNGFMPEQGMVAENLDVVGKGNRVHTFFQCPTPGAGNSRSCQIDAVEPAFFPQLFMSPAFAVGAGRQCPTPAQSPIVTTTLILDAAAVAEDLFEVEFSYQADDGPPVIVDVRKLSGLSGGVRAMDDCDRECFGLQGIARAEHFQVIARVPPHPAGTRLTYSFQARDLLHGTESLLREESSGTEELVFGYTVSEGVSSPVVLNEVLFDNGNLLAELYSEEDLGADGFQGPDYLELFNAGDISFDLSGAFLTHAEDRLCTAGAICLGDAIADARAYEFPQGTAIAPRDVLLVLFVSAEQGNTEPNLSGQPFEGKTVIARDAFRIDDCLQSLFLTSADDAGNCQLSRIAFGNPTTPCADMSDIAFGRSRDGTGGVVQLSQPTPGVPNCGRAPELNTEIDTVVLGPDDPGGCVGPANTIQLSWHVTVDLLEFESNPDQFGLGSIEVIFSFDGVEDPPRPVDEFSPEIGPGSVDHSGDCRYLLPMRIEVPGPGREAERFGLAVRITDTTGRALVVDLSGFAVCENSERPFLRGDINGDGRINLTDVVALLRVLNDTDPVPSCADALDVNDDGSIDAGDRDHLSDFVGGSVSSLPDPFPEPGIDPSGDNLSCR